MFIKKSITSAFKFGVDIFETHPGPRTLAQQNDVNLFYWLMYQPVNMQQFLYFSLQVLCNGRVCDPEERAADKDLEVPHDLNVKVREDPRVVMCLLPFADGVTIVMKL